MNEQEAIAVLQQRIDVIEDDQAYSMLSKALYEDGYRRMEAFAMAVKALTEVGSTTTQLDENGLAPCGCGGKAKIWPSEPTQFTKVITDYEVGCTECAMTTGWVRGKQEHAVETWNTAMGWKGGAEELGDVKSAQRLTDI